MLYRRMGCALGVCAQFDTYTQHPIPNARRLSVAEPASRPRYTGDSHWGTHPLCAAQIASPDADSLSLIVGGGLREAQGQSACRNSNTYWGVRLGRQGRATV